MPNEVTSKPYVSESQMPVETVSKNLNETKVSEFAQKLMSSKFFRNVMGFIGHIAVALGSSYLLDKVKQYTEGKKVGDYPVDGVAKAIIKTGAGAAKEKINEFFEPGKIPPHIYNTIVRYQKDAEYREDACK